jgi:exopolyphosphatase/guanosine-5'-triphosphate,3'-diphosphate pyrophosphatase
MLSGPVAVVDIGSNSIKVLVAVRSADGNVHALAMRTLDARISSGINQSVPRLSEEGIARGIEAVRTLLSDAAEHAPARIILVATSAVRDAQNGAEFRERVRDATGHEIRILSGEEEANLIGRGLTADPALRHLRNFYVFDLGGGSLECLAFRERQIEQAVSVRLGCVRLTEKFVANPALPLPLAVQKQVSAHTREVITQSGFQFSLPIDAVAVGTGGTVTTVRAILGSREGKALESTSTMVTVAQLRELLATLAVLPLEERKRVPGLPPARADVFPAALTTLIAVADIGGVTAYHNSLYNLRYGLAADALSD